MFSQSAQQSAQIVPYTYAGAHRDMRKKPGGGQDQWVQREQIDITINISIYINTLQNNLFFSYWVHCGNTLGTLWEHKISVKNFVPSRWVQNKTAKISLKAPSVVAFLRKSQKPLYPRVPTGVGTNLLPESPVPSAFQGREHTMFPLYPPFLPPIPFYPLNLARCGGAL